MNLPRHHILAPVATQIHEKCAAMAFVVFIPALLNEEATDAPAHGDDLARRHTADLRSVGASWLRCMLGLAADAAAHMLRRVWCHAEKICFDGSSCRSKVRGTGVNRMVRGGRQRHGLPMEHWCSGRRDPSAALTIGRQRARGIKLLAFRSFGFGGAEPVQMSSYFI